MKKLLAGLLVLTLLVACGGSGSNATIKLGVASTQGAKVDEKDANKAEYTTVVVAVALKDDKVAYVSIDESQQFANIVDGAVVTETERTKKEKGLDYDMKGASEAAGLGKEWDEQIKALEEALIGLTKDEVVALFAGEDVKSSATIFLGNIEATVVKAIDAAVEVKDVAKVGLGYVVSNQIGRSGGSETVMDYAFIAVDKDDKIVSAQLDAAQEKVDFVDGAHKPQEINQTKGELKDKYAMIGASPIKAEWYTQNDSLMEALVGKTFDEAAGLENSKDDLETTVTMLIASYQAAIENAKAALTELK